MIQELNRYKKLKSITGGQAVLRLEDIVGREFKELTPREYDIFQRVVILADMVEEIEADHVLPSGYTTENVESEYKKIQSYINQPILEALERRQQHTAEIVNNYIDAMKLIKLNVEGKFTRQNYFRHQVLEYMSAKSKITGTGGAAHHRGNSRGWAKQRQGTEKDINQNYLQSEYEVYANMLYDIEVAEMLSRIDQRYGIKDKLKGEARYNNRLIREENNERVEELIFGDQSAMDMWTSYKKKIAIALSRVRKVAEADKLFIYSGHEITIGRLKNGQDVDLSDLFSLLNVIANDEFAEEDAVISARTVFKAVREREAFVKSTLGEVYTEPNVKWRDLIPEGYTTWQPVKGKRFVMVDGLSQKLMDQFVEDQLESIQVTEDQLSKFMAILGNKEEMVLPENVAVTLDDVYNSLNKVDKVLGKILKGFQHLWKRWILTLNPRQIIKYNLRNITGDFDGAIAANGIGVLKKNYIGRAAKELYDAMRYHKFSADMMMFMDKGGYQDTLFSAEIAEVQNLKSFRHLNIVDEQSMIKRILDRTPLLSSYAEYTENLTNYRESILRYALFLAYKDQLTQSKGKVKNYGASNKSRIDGLSLVEDRAYQMSKDALGAYDEITEVGQVLREYLIPFYSWNEVNFKRYKRVIENTVNEIKMTESIGDSALKSMGLAGKMTGKAAVIVGRNTLRVFFLTAALQLFNSLVMGDDDDKLPDGIRNMPHITLGHNYKGEIIYFSRLGAINDILEWFGLDQLPSDIEQLAMGRKSVAEQASDMAFAPINKIINSFSPFLKSPVELMAGSSYYPDIRSPRRIRDVGYYMTQSLGLQEEYSRLAGIPRDDTYQESWEKAFIYKTKPEVSAYYKVLDLKEQYRSNVLGEHSSYAYNTSEKSKALYYYKLSLKYGDDKAASKFLDKYFEYGGTSKGLQISLKSLDPLYGLNEYEMAGFTNWLTTKEQETLLLALEYYHDLMTGETD